MPPNAGKGRKKGTPNKTTRLLKEAILRAAENVGNEQGGEGLVSYLEGIARDEPRAFTGLLGRVLPYQVTGDPDNPIVSNVKWTFVHVAPSDREE